MFRVMRMFAFFMVIGLSTLSPFVFAEEAGSTVIVTPQENLLGETEILLNAKELGLKIDSNLKKIESLINQMNNMSDVRKKNEVLAKHMDVNMKANINRLVFESEQILKELQSLISRHSESQLIEFFAMKDSLDSIFEKSFWTLIGLTALQLTFDGNIADAVISVGQVFALVLIINIPYIDENNKRNSEYYEKRFIKRHTGLRGWWRTRKARILERKMSQVFSEANLHRLTPEEAKAMLHSSLQSVGCEILLAKIK